METWTSDFIKQMACAKFLAATAPWTADARRAARLPVGAKVATTAAGAGGEEAVAAADMVV